jgi:thioredoxin-related protein
MKQLFFSLFASALVFQVGASEPAWLTDPGKAQSQAKQENKLVLINFTGSDWCGWCIRLKKEVFSTPEFEEYSKKNLVLLEIDFPRAKPQTDEQKNTNRALAAKYKVRGYPTVIVLDSEGKQVGQLGYMQGGPKAFIGKLNELKKS